MLVSKDSKEIVMNILDEGSKLIEPKIIDDAQISIQQSEIALQLINEIKQVVIDWLNEDRLQNQIVEKISSDTSPETIFAEIKASMISQKRRQDIHTKIHNLQQHLLSILGRSIEIKNIDLKQDILIYDLDSDATEIHGKFLTYVRGLELAAKDLDNDSIRKKTTDFPKLNAVYKSANKQYEKFKTLTDKSGGGSYIFWRMSNKGKWNKIYILNRGSLAEIYMAHFYAGQQQDNYDKNFDPIIPTGYNYFFYQKASRISKKTSLFHEVTNAPGFLEEDIDLGGGKYIGIKYGTDYNIYKITNILRLLGQLYNDIEKDKTKIQEHIMNFDKKLKKGKVAPQIIPEVGAWIDKNTQKEVEAVISSSLKIKT